MMINKLLFFMLIALAGAGSAFKAEQDDVFTIDTKKSKVLWTGKNVLGGTHSGELSVSSGTLLLKDGQLAGGTFVVDMNSLLVTDPSGDRGKNLASHLKNEDFFDVPKFAVASFKITKVAKAETPDQMHITGDLTIRDITRSITFPATVYSSESSIHATANRIRIDRTQFDIKFRSGSFFSGLGDRAISDEFELNVEITAAK